MSDSGTLALVAFAVAALVLLALLALLALGLCRAAADVREVKEDAGEYE